MSQGTKQQAVRLPLDLHAKIVAAATESNRSGHAEMLHRLEQSFTESNGIVDMVRGDLNALEERLLKKLAPEMFITSVHIDTSHMSKEDIDRLSESQPEISGLTTLPQAIRRTGKAPELGMGFAGAGQCDKETPEDIYSATAAQLLADSGNPGHLTTPGALEWEHPGVDTSWRVHNGSSPVGLWISADTLVDVERRDRRQLLDRPAGGLSWAFDKEPGPFDIMFWRLAK